MSVRHITLLFLGFFIVNVAQAELKDENLLQDIPPGYKVGFQAKRGAIFITELIPEQETVENWSEMITTQVFLGLNRPTPSEFRQGMQHLWAQSCPGSQFANVAKGTENGYLFEVWIQDCPLSMKTGKPERVWLKAIKGNDSFYLVQKAFRFAPNPDQIVRWTKYLASIRVCDTRLPDRQCSFPTN